MKVSLKPEKYIVAVSGGVDSIVLLDLLVKNPGLDLLVAHFNHGIRADSKDDEKLVKDLAKKYHLTFEAGQGNLDSSASEELARKARYKFLEEVKAKHNAQAIITAHHQDDLIETALINILRGTGPQGLVAIQTNTEVLRPMLRFTKKQIYDYAKKHNLAWREDSSNQNTDYLRNYVRHNLTGKLSQLQRDQILASINQIAKDKQTKDQLLEQLSKVVKQNDQISRTKFVSLPTEVGSELIVYWLRQLGLADFDKHLVNKLNVLLRTAQPNTRHNIKKGVDLAVNKLTAQFTAQG